MKTYYYNLTFSPYTNIVKARNKKEAWKIIKKRWSEYKSLKKVVIW